MAKATYVQPGHMLDFVAPADMGANDIIYDSTHGLLAVCAGDIPKGKTGALAIDGVFAIPKAATAIAQFDDVYWDDDNECVTNVESEGAVACGIAVAAAAADDATVNVLINARM